jgi:PLP dependent protein
MMMEHIKRNIDKVLERMAGACARSGRAPGDVSLCAVTKTHSVEEIQAVLDAGVKIIGESRVQEAASKMQLRERNFEFHMIGHLQTNKADLAVKMFDLVQSVDSLKLAEKLAREAEKAGRAMKVFVQVHSTDEETKSGLGPDEFLAEAEKIMKLGHIDVRGVMTIGPFTDDEAEIRKSFALTRALYDELRKSNSGIKELSMGMTDDFEIAIEEGATLVRVGRALFERG